MALRTFDPGLAYDRATGRALPSMRAVVLDAATDLEVQTYDLDGNPAPVITDSKGYFWQFQADADRVKIKIAGRTLESLNLQAVLGLADSASAAQTAAEQAATSAQTAATDALAGAQADLDAAAASAASSAQAARDALDLVDAPAGAAIAANLKGKGTVSDQDYASLEAALADLATGGVLEVSKAWSRSTTWTINKSCTVRFLKGGSITTTVASIAAITVAANDVYLDSPQAFGTGSATASTGTGIYALGTVAARITGLRIRAPRISNFTQYGIYLELCDGFTVERVNIDNIAYAGVMILSGTDGIVDGGTIKNITQPSGFVNSYGVAATHNMGAPTASSPRSKNITFTNLTIDGVPNWEGIDTHGGIQIKAIGNTIRNVKYGVVFGPGNDAGVTKFAAKDCIVRGNIIDSGRTDGVATIGINFLGCSTGLGFHNSVDFATGVIEGNILLNFGTDGGVSGGSISLQDTRGVVVSGNVIYRSAVAAIRLDYNNKDVTLIGNTATDTWANAAASASMIVAQSFWNTGKLTGNTVIRGSLSAPVVNSIGMRVSSSVGTTFIEQGNDFTAAAIPYSLGANGVVRFDQRGFRHGYVTALPTLGVWQRGSQAFFTAPSASTSPGWVCVLPGGASSATWAAATAYAAGVWVKTAAGAVMECVVAGTSGSTEPTLSVIDGTVTDGTVTWVYRSATSATFKAMPNLAA